MFANWNAKLAGLWGLAFIFALTPALFPRLHVLSLCQLWYFLQPGPFMRVVWLNLEGAMTCWRLFIGTSGLLIPCWGLFLQHSALVQNYSQNYSQSHKELSLGCSIAVSETLTILFRLNGSLVWEGRGQHFHTQVGNLCKLLLDQFVNAQIRKEFVFHNMEPLRLEKGLH